MKRCTVHCIVIIFTCIRNIDIYSFNINYLLLKLINFFRLGHFLFLQIPDLLQKFLSFTKEVFLQILGLQSTIKTSSLSSQKLPIKPGYESTKAEILKTCTGNMSDQPTFSSNIIYKHSKQKYFTVHCIVIISLAYQI